MNIPELRAKAARGIMLTLDELRQFVAATRVSYKAAESNVKAKADPAIPKLSRVKKDAPQDVDFF